MNKKILISAFISLSLILVGSVFAEDAHTNVSLLYGWNASAGAFAPVGINADGSLKTDLNSSDFWDNLDVPDDIVYSDLKNGFWDANVDLDANNFTIDTSTFFVDSSSNRVGIGTTNPTSKLVVKGDGADIALIDAAGGNMGLFGADGANNGVFQLYNGAHALVIHLDSKTGDDSYINNGGNFGIGTTSPGTYGKFVIKQAAGTPYFIIGESGVAKDLQLGWDITNSHGIINTPGYSYSIEIDASDIILNANSAGNVGIGITPQTAHTAYSALSLGGNVWWGAETTAGAGKSLHFLQNGYVDAAGNWKYISTDEASHYEQTDGKHRFFTAVSGTAGNTITWGTEKMVILNNGNVGIGTTSPDDHLHIRTSASDTGMIIDSVGNNFPQLIFGADRTAVTSTIGRIKAQWDGNDVAAIALLSDTDTTNKDDGQIRFYTSDNAATLDVRMTINKDGNVGIGTTEPAAKLHVSSAVGTNYLKVQDTRSTTGDSAGMMLGTHSRLKSLIAHVETGDWGVGDLIFAVDSNANSADVVLTDEKMRILSNGNVGIGTASPDSILSVSYNLATTFPTNLASYNGLLVKNVNTGVGTTAQLHLRANGADAHINAIYKAANTVDLAINLDNAGTKGNVMYLQANGNVGIGDTNPGEKLEVAGRISLTTDPNSADDVGDRGYNDVRYEEEGVTCTDCVSTVDVDDDGSGACASGKVCTGGHSHSYGRMAINNCLWSGSSVSACYTYAQANEAWGYVCIEFPSDTWQLCTIEAIAGSTY